MTKKEELKQHQDKLADIKSRLTAVQQEWVAYNQLFNDWMQRTLNVQDQKGEIHLSEILTKWDKMNDQSPQA